MGHISSSSESNLLERVAAEENLLAAWGRGRANHGAPGVDGVTIEAFEADFGHRLAAAQAALLADAYRPSPLRCFDIPKASGGMRTLGIPTVRDRLVLQAISQVLAPLWEPDFSPYSFAYRPGRTPQQAVAAAQAVLRTGRRWVVDLDIAQFFDNVDHVRLMLRLGQRVADARLLDLIADFLRAGRSRNGVVAPTRMGIAQGSPLSPLLANIVLDELDQELAQRHWPFVRFADDSVVFARTESEGRQMVQVIADFLHQRLNLRLHPGKTKVVQPTAADYLGFTYRIGSYGQIRRRVTRPAVMALRQRVEELAKPCKGDSLDSLAARVSRHVRGWAAYYGFGQTGVVPAALAWVRRRLRAAAWGLWRTPARRQKELERRGVPPAQAAQAAWSLQLPDAFGDIPALVRALPDASFARWGLTKSPGSPGQRTRKPPGPVPGPTHPAVLPDSVRHRLFARIARRLRIVPERVPLALRSTPTPGTDSDPPQTP